MMGVEFDPSTEREVKGPSEVLHSQELALTVKPVSTVVDWTWVIKSDGVLVCTAIYLNSVSV